MKLSLFVLMASLVAGPIANAGMKISGNVIGAVNGFDLSRFANSTDCTSKTLTDDGVVTRSKTKAMTDDVEVKNSQYKVDIPLTFRKGFFKKCNFQLSLARFRIDVANFIDQFQEDSVDALVEILFSETELPSDKFVHLSQVQALGFSRLGADGVTRDFYHSVLILKTGEKVPRKTPFVLPSDAKGEFKVDIQVLD